MRLSSLLLISLLSGAAYADDAQKSDADWDFKSQAVFYYQTADNWGNGQLFDQGPSGDNEGWAAATAGIQFIGENKDLFGGLGVGFELNGLSNLGLDDSVVSGMPQRAHEDPDGNGAALSRAYLTYGISNTKFKYGRQHLPKGLSPFAFTEGWNVFKNSFEGLLVVNTDIKDTTVVLASVAKHNNSVGDISEFTDFHTAKGDVGLLTVQNKSFGDLTLTGSYYWIPDAVWANGGYATDADALWLDASFKLKNGTSGAIQGGKIGGLSLAGAEDTTAFGAKVAGKFGDVNWSFAVSSTDDGTLNVANLAGTGVKTPLFTQSVLNQNAIKRDSESFKFTLSTKVYEGKFTFAYTASNLGDTALPTVFGQGVGGDGKYSEFDFIYVKNFTKELKVFFGLISQYDDRQADEDQNLFRVWARYNF